MNIAGIDYSMTGPSMCIHDGPVFSFKNCVIYFLTDIKKYHGRFHNFQLYGSQIPDKFDSQEHRFDMISNVFMQMIELHEVPEVGIEDYAFAAKGRVFHIAENTGLLKHKLWTTNRKIHTFSPSQIKKAATGKGNATKDMMYAAFLKETDVDLVKIFEYNKSKIESPIADIVDSYYVCKYLFNINRP